MFTQASSDFLDREMARWEAWEATHQQPPISSAPVDELFRTSLTEIWRNEGIHDQKEQRRPY
jgi:hypothetical protein